MVLLLRTAVAAPSVRDEPRATSRTNVASRALPLRLAADELNLTLMLTDLLARVVS